MQIVKKPPETIQLWRGHGHPGRGWKRVYGHHNGWGRYLPGRPTNCRVRSQRVHRAEACLIDDAGTHRRAATVLAVGDTTVMVLTRDALQSAGLGETSRRAVNSAADRRYTQLIKQDELRALGIKQGTDKGEGKKSDKRPASHKVRYTVDFIAPPIGLVLEGKFHLVVRGFETQKAKGQAGEAVSSIRVGDCLVGCQRNRVQKRETHKQRMSVIQGERWPLRLLFQRVVAGPGPRPIGSPRFRIPRSCRVDRRERSDR